MNWSEGTDVQQMFLLFVLKFRLHGFSPPVIRRPSLLAASQKVQITTVESSFCFLCCAGRLPPAGEEADCASCWDSWEMSRSTLWTRTASRTFCSSVVNRLRTWRSTEVFPDGRPIPTRSLGITWGERSPRGHCWLSRFQ